MLEGTNPASCFPRCAIGYEAACYSRIWSEVCLVQPYCSCVLLFYYLDKIVDFSKLYGVCSIIITIYHG